MRDSEMNYFAYALTQVKLTQSRHAIYGRNAWFSYQRSSIVVGVVVAMASNQQ